MAGFSQPSFLTGPPQPLVLSLEGRTESPLELYGNIASSCQPSFLLETGPPHGGEGHYSFIGSDPIAVVSDVRDFTHERSKDPFELLKPMVASSRMGRFPNLPPFFGGAVGFFSYDFVRRLESIPSMTLNDRSIPLFQFAFFDLVTAIDHRRNRIQVIFCPPMERFLGERRETLYREGVERLEECAGRLARTTAKLNLPPIEPVPFRAEQTRESYLDRVRRCQCYIADGDIYQANLSHRFGFEIPARYRTGLDRLRYEHALYGRLRIVNPSPFSGLIRFENVSLISSSPERLVRLRGRCADTRPIAGTRPRGRSLSDDRRLVEELLTNKKERAEHLMLVDLERNDLGRVCEFGTVTVDEFMIVEQYSHVSHIVSNVRGILREDATPFDLISATFPGGTITGVPKIRCMEIIEELEPVRRGPYTGSFGYIGWNGDLDLNIIIRTLVLSGETGHLQVGAGIVADSDPDLEYEETLHKAQAFFTSLRQDL